MLTMDMLLSDPIAVKEAVNEINLATIGGYMMHSQYREYLLADAGQEHYKLLSATAAMFEGQTVFDIGTHLGNSSLAMGFNSKVRVVSYDIVDMKQILVEPNNVIYKIGDFRDDPEVLNSPFIFIDVDPHDGIQEKEFDEWFREMSYRGVVMWDDIYCNEHMTKWWNALPEPKYDLTLAGHWSGTGMCIYG